MAIVYGSPSSHISEEVIEAATAVTSIGGVVCLPTDTVYGLAVDPNNDAALGRIAVLKGRPVGKPNAVMFWNVDQALSLLGPVDEAVEAAMLVLLPGPVGLLLPNQHGVFLAACGDSPETVGVRVPVVSAPVDAPPVAQTSANLSGDPDPQTLDHVPDSIRGGVDLALDGGALKASPSTIVDLRSVSARHPDRWRIVREGAVEASEISQRLQQGLR